MRSASTKREAKVQVMPVFQQRKLLFLYGAYIGYILPQTNQGKGIDFMEGARRDWLR